MTIEEIERLEHLAQLAVEGQRAIAMMPGDCFKLCQLARKALENDDENMA